MKGGTEGLNYKICFKEHYRFLLFERQVTKSRFVKLNWKRNFLKGSFT